MTPAPVPGWYSGITRWRSNARWVLYCTPRNPFELAHAKLGLRSGECGFRRKELVEEYWRSLNRAYRFLTGRGAPVLKSGFPSLQIYLVATRDGSTSPVIRKLHPKQGPTKLDMGILIELPVRNAEPVWETELAQALTTLVHEMVHALNMQVLPLAQLIPPDKTMKEMQIRAKLLDSWEWLDEGMAVAAEAAFALEQDALRKKSDATALPMNQDWLSWALSWVDYPERSLTDEDMVYQAGFFVRYLERRMGGPQFVHQVWAKSKPVWDVPAPQNCTPLKALTESFHDLDQEFCSAEKPDVFASGFCFESYFLNDPTLHGYEPLVFGRFRERAVTQTWRMDRREDWPDGKADGYRLPGLACRYFRFMPPAQPERLEIRLKPASGHSTNTLKAELVLTQLLPGGDGFSPQRDGEGRVVRVTLKVDPEWSGELFGAIEGFAPTCHHAALVVTNCDLGLPYGVTSPVEFHLSARLSDGK